MMPGDIANENGDIHFSENCGPITEGLLGLTFEQALKAIPFGWHWVEVLPDRDGNLVSVMRGGMRWKTRAPC